MGTSRSLHEVLTEAARAEGFPLASTIDLEPALSAKGPFSEHVQRYDRWLAEGHAGAMSYLERGRDRRADPRAVFPAAKSMLCAAIPYSRRPAGAEDALQGPRYARYLKSGDYHRELASRMERAMELAARVRPDLEWKVCVDTSAVLERSWAALAGLGWIGKNTLLIHPRYGSYLFLAEALINQETGKGPAPLPDYCGNCSRCLQACPTGAFREPRWLDSRKCVSYGTLEKRGPLEWDSATRASAGSWIAGCDACQEACPFNLKPSREDEDFAAGPTGLASWEELLDEPEESYLARSRGTALSRVKPAQFRRNLALALANAAQAADERSRAELALRIRGRVAARFESETDPDARAEWARLKELIG